MAEIILTGVDDSETARKAAGKAASLAAALGFELHVLSAFTVNMAETFRSVRQEQDPEVVSSQYQETIKQHERDAQGTASTVAEKLQKDFPNLNIVPKAVEGSPAAALVREAERLDAEIIVVGNKRVQGPARVLGSIARTVASEADCDLYVVHTHAR